MIKVWIGDLRYHTALGDNWDEVCDDICENGAKYNKFDRTYGAYATLWGDGEYQGSDGNLYPVNSGTIGFVTWHPDDGFISGMYIHEFEKIPSIKEYGEGIIRISDGVYTVDVYTGDDEVIASDEV